MWWHGQKKNTRGKVIADHTAPPHFEFKKSADSLLPALSQVDNFQSLSTTCQTECDRHQMGGLLQFSNQQRGSFFSHATSIALPLLAWALSVAKGKVLTLLPCSGLFIPLLHVPVARLRKSRTFWSLLLLLIYYYCCPPASFCFPPLLSVSFSCFMALSHLVSPGDKAASSPSPPPNS